MEGYPASVGTSDDEEQARELQSAIGSQAHGWTNVYVRSRKRNNTETNCVTSYDQNQIMLFDPTSLLRLIHSVPIKLSDSLAKYGTFT